MEKKPLRPETERFKHILIEAYQRGEWSANMTPKDMVQELARDACLCIAISKVDNIKSVNPKRLGQIKKHTKISSTNQGQGLCYYFWCARHVHEL